MTLVDERVMDTIGRNTANIQGLQVEDCEVSFAQDTLSSLTEIYIYPQSSQVRAEQLTNPDTVQAGTSGLTVEQSGNIFFIKARF